MTREEVMYQVDNSWPCSGYFIGTKAYHLLGDISRDEGDLFYTTGQNDDYYIGSWVTGFGFVDVCFPKGCCRDLTDEEIEEYNKTYIQINNQPPQQLKVD